MEGNRVFAAEFGLEEVAQPAMNFEQRLKVVEMRHAILVVLTPKVAPVYVPPRDHAPTEAEKEWMSLVDVAAKVVGLYRDRFDQKSFLLAAGGAAGNDLEFESGTLNVRLK